MRNTGNILFMAETQLIKEKRNGVIPCYTELDVLVYAERIRKFLDNTPAKKINKLMNQTKKEKRLLNNMRRRNYHARTGR